MSTPTKNSKTGNFWLGRLIFQFLTAWIRSLYFLGEILMSTIREIAKIAGVSPSLVSRIINNDPSLRVSDQTRRTVKQVISQTNYVVKHGSRNEIIILMAISQQRQSQDLYFSNLHNDILYHCKNNNLKVLKTIWLPDEDQIANLDKVSGVMVVGPFTASTIVKIKQVARSFVLVDDNTSVPNINQVKSNFDTITNTILNGFWHRSREKIAFIGGSIIRISGAGKNWGNLIDIRLATYYEWIRKHSFAPDILNVGLTIADGQKAATQLLARKKENPYAFPNAIVALNDMIARGLVDELTESGIRIPEDVSLVGFDDLSITRIRKPTITSVNIPTNGIANAAVRLLRDQLNKSIFGNNIITVPGKLIYRDSFPEKVN
ncbi:transcriptional regulator, LacI family [Lentilactobacillus kisonensis F0435]|uniref:Transcriptional regulator, LacI family n=2 Tax=Lentilactobacillus kisonensis TaxID=481722 RepID=H1LFS5_9LACO|nr:transcriptional regulator, LacI family [Lentilactobacillus kisonensis F0435]